MSIQALENLRREKEDKSGQKMTAAAELKRKERQEKKVRNLAAAAAAAAAAAQSGEVPDGDSSLAALLAPDASAELATSHATASRSSTPNLMFSDASHTAHTIIIPATSADHPWFRPPEYETLDAAREAGVWTYPSTVIERAKCAVFRDLIEKGYFIGGGIKFGGDWLVYPGALLCVALLYP